jgi:hypothetical protein
MTPLLLPLVPEAPLPWRAPAAVRSEVPRGYGVQEQCLPFTAACALGLLVPAPFDFGLCAAAAVPADALPFAPPDVARPAGDERVFYVRDHAGSRFHGNAFDADPLPFTDAQGRALAMRPQQPGISFMDRPDQTLFFKLHLPWLLRTPTGVDSLFGPPLNRPAPLQLLTGLVETDWYAHPVNLVVQRPAQGALHIRRGEVIAQLHFVQRESRRAEPQVLQRDSAQATQLREELRQWFAAHQADRSTYRRQARSQQGRVAPAADGPPGDASAPGTAERATHPTIPPGAR